MALLEGLLFRDSMCIRSNNQAEVRKMRPRFGILRSMAVLALAAGAVVMLGATANAQLLKNMNNSNFSGPYACRGARVVEGLTFS